jgi:DNA repair exonuclease SbcCD nuclease subunit
MSFVLLGDPHIGKSVAIGKVGIGSALNSRVSDQMDLLDWTLDQALLHNSSCIIITGDVWEDPKPFPYLIALFIGWLKRCAINDVYVHIIMGNHDILRTGNYYTSPLDIISECELDNVSIHRDLNTIFMGSVAFTFMPFRDRKSFNVESNSEALALLKNSLVYELTAIPNTYKKILVGHLAIEGSIPVGDEIDDLTNELFCPVDMFNGYDYVWMGHVHNPQVMSYKPYVAHIGSMDISNFGETDHKKHIIIYDIEEEEEFKKITIPTRSLQKIVISIPKEVKNTTKFVLDEINEKYSNLNKAIVRLEVHLASHDLVSTNRSEIEKSLYDLGVFNVSSISESKKLAPIRKDGNTDINNTMDAPSAIKLWAATQIDAQKHDKFVEVSLGLFRELLQNKE